MASSTVDDRIATPDPNGPSVRSDRIITGSDVEAGLRRWSEGTRQHLTPQLGRKVAAGVLVAVLLGAGAAAGTLDSSFRSQSAQNTDRIATLQRELAGIAPVGATQTAGPVANPTPAPDGAAVAGVNDLLTAATLAAGKVADGQQRYAELARNATTTGASTGNGAPSAAVLAMVEHRKDLAPLWDQAALVVPETDAYAYSSTAGLDDPSRIDPRFPWYVRHDGTTASSPASYAWSVDTVTPFNASTRPGAAAPATTARTADVVWLCREKAGDQAILAWASAVYDAGTGRFSNLVVDTTAAGAQHRSQANAAPGPSAVASTASASPLAKATAATAPSTATVPTQKKNG